MEAKIEAISVTRLARKVRTLLEMQIGELWVEGEVSNLRKQGSGHWYFSLKDANAQFSCAMFGARRCPGSEVLTDGAKVMVFAEVSFYEVRGTTQLVVRKARAVGLGDLQARFEALKRLLQKEGLFEQSRKRALPGFPKRIGIVTSGTGAALQDMMNVLNRRAPWLKVVLFSTAVQGQGAEYGIAERIAEAGRQEKALDALIVGRGGGSLEDLWNFNEEVVARAIVACPVPVISAVGHEIDFTIADFVADLRAPTPSAAAELVAPSYRELSDRLEGLESRLLRRTKGQLQTLSQRLDYLANGPIGRDPQSLIVLRRQRFDLLKSRLIQQVQVRLTRLRRETAESRLSWQQYHPLRQVERKRQGLEEKRRRLQIASEAIINRYRQLLALRSQKLRLLSPQDTLQRGFSIALNKKGEAVTSPNQVETQERLELMTADGVIPVEVTEESPTPSEQS